MGVTIFVYLAGFFIVVVDGQGVSIVDFKPDIYPSGSTVISVQDIGELQTDFSNTNEVVACRTDRRPCCSTQPNRLGDWIYNNGTIIGNRASNGIDFFRSRDDNQMIYLSLRSSATNPPTGEFCCVIPNSLNVMQTICIDLVSITLNIVITTSGTAALSEMYSFTCTPSVTSGETLSSITWFKNNQELSRTTTESYLTYTITSLTAGDSGDYTCRVDVGSFSKILTKSLEISIHVSPSMPRNFRNTSVSSTEVVLTWTSPSPVIIKIYTISYRRVGGCTDAPSGTASTSMTAVTISGLEENIEYEFTLTATNNGGSSTPAKYTLTTLSTAPREAPQLMLESFNATSFTVSWIREPCLSRNGPDRYYTVRYYETGSTKALQLVDLDVSNTMYTTNPLNPVTSYTIDVAYINTIGSSPNSTLTVTTLGLPYHAYLNGVAYPTNSLVNLSDIGLDNNLLICYTDYISCCRNEDNPSGVSLGSWQDPNNSFVNLRQNANSHVFSRSRSKQAVILHRGINAVGLSGIYTCNIPDQNRRNKKLYFGIYNDGEGLLDIQNITYNTTTGIVTCVSTGGPVTTLTWNRRGGSYSQSKIVVDTLSATYHNLLSISGNTLPDYTGIFSCTVSNSRGTTYMTTTEFKVLGMTGNRNTYEVGSTASVLCYSNFTGATIRWLNASSAVSFSANEIRQNELLLSIDETITHDIHGTMFICEVRYRIPSGEKTETKNFTIRTTEEYTATIQPDNTLNINIAVVVISVLVCLILITGIIPTTIIVVYKMRGCRKTTTTKAATDLTDREYEVIDDSQNKNSVKNHDFNLSGDINMRHCVAYGEIKTAEPSHESQNTFESYVYEKVQ